MSWRDRARNIGKGPSWEPTKPTKPGFVSFGSAQDGHFVHFRAGERSTEVTCAGCRYFEARPGDEPDGHCRLYTVATWGAVPFQCEGYSPADRAARALEQRRRKVEQHLRDTPSLRLAADVTDAPLGPEPGCPVSIVLAVRTTAGIVSGELQAPRERFNTGVFLAYLKSIPEVPS